MEKNGDEIRKKYILHIKCIDRARFIATSISNVFSNLSEGTHRIKCKYGHETCETCGTKYKYCTVFLNIQTLKMI